MGVVKAHPSSLHPTLNDLVLNWAGPKQRIARSFFFLISDDYEQHQQSNIFIARNMGVPQTPSHYPLIYKDSVIFIWESQNVWKSHLLWSDEKPAMLDHYNTNGLKRPCHERKTFCSPRTTEKKQTNQTEYWDCDFIWERLTTPCSHFLPGWRYGFLESLQTSWKLALRVLARTLTNVRWEWDGVRKTPNGSSFAAWPIWLLVRSF